MALRRAIGILFGRLGQLVGDRGCKLVGDAVLAELRPEHARTAWPEALPLVEPILRKGDVINQANGLESLHNSVDDGWLSLSQAASDLAFAPRPLRQKAQRRLHGLVGWGEVRRSG